MWWYWLEPGDCRNAEMTIYVKLMENDAQATATAILTYYNMMIASIIINDSTNSWWL